MYVLDVKFKIVLENIFVITTILIIIKGTTYVSMVVTLCGSLYSILYYVLHWCVKFSIASELCCPGSTTYIVTVTQHVAGFSPRQGRC